jgi:hypothetical protein
VEKNVNSCGERMIRSNWYRLSPTVPVTL